MKEKIVSAKLYESDRDWLERLKRRLKKKSSYATFRAMKKVFIRLNLVGEMEWKMKEENRKELIRSMTIWLTYVWGVLIGTIITYLVYKSYGL